MAEKLEFIIGARDAFSKTFGVLGTGLTRATKLAAGASAAVAGLSVAIFAMAKSTAAANDDIGKFAGRIGVAVEELSAYQHVAELSGVATSNLNVGWQRMTRRIAEASQGTGVAVKALKDLNIEIADIQDLSPDKQFETIAIALDGVATQGEKVRLAMQFWDTEGVALLQTISGGSKALFEMKEEAKKLGLVISKEAAQSAADFNDSLTRLSGSLTGLKNVLGNDLLPVFTMVFTKISEIVSDNRDLIAKFLTDISKKTLETLTALLIGTAKLVDQWTPVIRGIKNRLLEVWETFRGLPEWVQTAGLVGALLGGRRGVFIIGGLVTLYDSLSTSLEGVQEVFKGNITFGQLATANHEELVAILEKLGSTSKSTKDDLDGVLDTVIDDGAIEAMGEMETKVRELIESIRELFATGGGEGEDGSPFNDTNTEKTLGNIGIIMEAVDEWRENITGWAEQIGELVTGTFDMVTKGVGDAVASAIFEGANLGKALKSLLVSVGKSIVSTLIKIGLERLILSVLNLGAAATESTARMAQLAAQTYASAFAATAVIPIIGPALAPGVAAAATSAMLAGSAAAASAGAAVGIAAHGGLDFVPREQTVRLDRGERVVSPTQNQDLTSFLAEGGGRGGVQVGQISILENATSLDAMLSMTIADWREVLEDKLYPAISELTTEGITP